MAKKQNTKKFIRKLSLRLSDAGIKCIWAEADADRLITVKALECAKDKEIIVHAEDTDVLILLLHLTTPELKNIVFIPHPKKTSKKKKQCWRIKEVQQCLGKDLCNRLPFIHAFSGCDTSSRPYGMGKATTLRKLKSQDLATCADVFINPISSVEQVVEAGDLAMRLLTGGKCERIIS